KDIAVRLPPLTSPTRQTVHTHSAGPLDALPGQAPRGDQFAVVLNDRSRRIFQTRAKHDWLMAQFARCNGRCLKCKENRHRENHAVERSTEICHETSPLGRSWSAFRFILTQLRHLCKHVSGIRRTAA